MNPKLLGYREWCQIGGEIERIECNSFIKGIDEASFGRSSCPSTAGRRKLHKLRPCFLAKSPNGHISCPTTRSWKTSVHLVFKVTPISIINEANVYSGIVDFPAIEELFRSIQRKIFGDLEILTMTPSPSRTSYNMIYLLFPPAMTQ